MRGMGFHLRFALQIREELKAGRLLLKVKESVLLSTPELGGGKMRKEHRNL